MMSLEVVGRKRVNVEFFMLCCMCKLEAPIKLPGL